MAVKVTDIKLNQQTMKAEVTLFADTKAEMTGLDTSDIIGFPAGYEIDFGSTVVTAPLDIGKMQSDGTWNWGE
jgi:hypothetical protein